MTEKIKFRKYHLVSNGITIGLFFLLLITMSISCGSGTSGDYTVMKGSFRQSVIEGGELEAIHASNIMMPRIAYQYGYQFKIIGLGKRPWEKLSIKVIQLSN